MVKLIKTTCPNCGGKLKIDSSQNKAKCEYCGAELLIDNDEVKLSNAFETGYEFEKNRQQFKDDKVAKQQQTYIDKNSEAIEKQKAFIAKNKRFIKGSKVKVSSFVIVGVLLAVLIVTFILGVVFFTASPYDQTDSGTKVYKLQSILYTKAVIAAMPETITGNDNGEEIVFHIEINDDYDSTKDDPVNQYRVYYYNEDGEKVVAADGVYHGKTEDMYALVGFFIAGMNSIKKLKIIVYVVLGVLIALFLAALIYLIYLAHAVSQDRKYSASYQEQKRNKELSKALKKKEKE